MATTARMKVKVSVPALLERVKVAKAAEEVDFLQRKAEYRKALAEHEAEVARIKVEHAESVKAFRSAVIDTLTDAIKSYRKSKEIRVEELYVKGRYTDCVTVPLPERMDVPEDKPSLPDPPREPKFPAHYDQDIALLEMATDQVLAIGSDDRFGKYL